jgi:glycosyltransferase involved in cell wall biosynthesis
MSAQRIPTIVFVAGITSSLEPFVVPLARHMSELGFRCVGVAGRGDTGTVRQGESFDALHEITPFRRRGAADVARAIRDLRRVVRLERPSLLHLHTPYAVALGRMVARATRTPHIAVIRGTLFDNCSAAGRLFSAIETATAWATPTYVTLNPDDQRTYRRLAPRSVVHLAPCGGLGIVGLDAERSHPAAPGPSDRPPRVLVMGRLTPDKNLDLAVAAWKRARRIMPNLELHIVGSTAQGEAAWTAPTDYGLVHRPWTARPSAEFANADVVLSTSLREGFPMVITEALALHTPVVAVDNRGTRAVVETVVEGMSLVPANESAIAAALLAHLRAPTVQVYPTALRSWNRQSVVAFHASKILDVVRPGVDASSPVGAGARQ